MADPARARLASAVRWVDHGPNAENIRHAMSRPGAEELRDALESRARILQDSRDELRGRAERAERELDRLRRDTGDQTAPDSPSAAAPQSPAPARGSSTSTPRITTSIVRTEPGT